MSCRNKVNFAGLLLRSNFCPGMKPTKIWSLLEGNDNQQQYSRVMCCYTLATFMTLVPSLIHLCLTPVTPFPSANTAHVSLQFSAHRSKLELVLMVQNLEVSLATVQLVKSCFKSSDNPGDINDLAPKRLSSAGFPSLSGEAVLGPSWAHPSSHVCIKGTPFAIGGSSLGFTCCDTFCWFGFVWVCVSVCEFVLIYIDLSRLLASDREMVSVLMHQFLPTTQCHATACIPWSFVAAMIAKLIFTQCKQKTRLEESWKRCLEDVVLLILHFSVCLAIVHGYPIGFSKH